MDFYEIEAKRMMAKYGIPVDEGKLYDKKLDLENIIFPCVVKAQHLSGKRGKYGGIKFVEKLNQLEDAILAVQQVTINGEKPSGVLIVPKANIKKEHYLGITLDRKNKSMVVLYSTNGGMDVEELSQCYSDKLMRLPIKEDSSYKHILKNISFFEEDKKSAEQICEISLMMIKMAFQLDATTVEINPLAELSDGQLMAVDAKLVIDDNALFRQEDFTIIKRSKNVSSRQMKLSQAGLAYVELESGGNIGVLAGGAGIGMATVDAIKFYGAMPFNFLDLGGGVTINKIRTAMSILLDVPEVEGIIVNIFGGANNCFTMAKGICEAIKQKESDKKVVVKSRGFNQEEGWNLYDEVNIKQVKYGTTDMAVLKLLKLLEVSEGIL